MRAVYRRRRFTALAIAAAVVVLVVLAINLVSGSGAGGTAPKPRRSAGGPAPRARASAAHARPRRSRTTTRTTGRHAPRPASRPRLSVEQLSGQRIIYAFSGLTPPPALLAAIRAGEAAGVILFSDNVSSLAQIRSLTDELQRANATSPVHAPLLILTDQEGGQVRRLPGAPALSEQAIGQSADPLAAARAAGAGAGHTLGAAGVNVNLSPVLDVMRAPDGFIGQFDRAYSSEAALTGRLGAAFIAAEQRVGVIATAKHFPGLGAAHRGQDTDSRPVTLRESLSELRSIDEAPYRRAIGAGVKLVMTSWAVFPALDPSRPAGLSPRVIQTELRGRLGFRGVTITDTLSAAALTPYGPLGQRAVLAARAGADLIICSAINGDDDPSGGTSVLHALAGAIVHGELSRAAAERSAARVLGLRAGLRRK